MSQERTEAKKCDTQMNTVYTSEKLKVLSVTTELIKVHLSLVIKKNNSTKHCVLVKSLLI